LTSIFDEPTFRSEAVGTSPLLKDVWLPNTLLMAARMQENSDKGLYLGCIAADNGKSHTHNDTGSVWIYLDGEPILIDLGNRQYTFQSFNTHRFEQQSIQSAFHNLPTIDGIQQGNGSAYRAMEHKYDRGTVSALRFQYARAYPEETQLRSLIRLVQLDRTTAQIALEDSFEFATPKPIVWSFMTCRPPDVQGAKVVLAPRPQDHSRAATMSFDRNAIRIQVETIQLDDPLQKVAWGDKVYRILATLNKPLARGTARFIFS
jgi:Heparinase II/III-like protein